MVGKCLQEEEEEELVLAEVQVPGGGDGKKGRDGPVVGSVAAP